MKGRFGYRFIDSPDRLTTPLIRKDGVLQPATWDEALQLVSGKLSVIKTEHGPDAIGGLSSARCTTEENYLFQKLMRAAVGTNNVDHFARPTVDGPADIFESGAMTNSIAEIQGMEVLLLIGTNTKESHPVIANQIVKAKRLGAKIIVADPRRVPMTRFADIHLRLNAGTDIALLNGIAHTILKEQLHDAEFISTYADGFEAWQSSLEAHTPEAVEKITGVPADAIVAAARMYGSSRKSSIFYTVGITPQDTARAIANLALLTGNIGRANTGVNPLYRQNNAQGASDAGALPDVLPGYHKITIPENMVKFEKTWGVSLPSQPGMTFTEMIPAAHTGRLKALFVYGENPAIIDPDRADTIEALKKLDFLVVQDIFLTETAQLADVVLPASCFAEKDGTFTNTERKVQRLRKAVTPPDDARDDLTILVQLSALLGYPMQTTAPADILAEFGSLWPALAGISYERLERGGIQWPCPSAEHPGTAYLYAQGFGPGRAPFSPVVFTAPAEVVDDEYTFALTTSRNLTQHRADSMTRRVGQIELKSGSPYIELNPADAALLDVVQSETVEVASRRGSVTLPVRITPHVDSGIVCIPMHFHKAAATMLANTAPDHTARTPELKVCAVKIRKSSSNN